MLTQHEKGLHWQAIVFYALFLQRAKSVIAGGAARDILMGNAPRDYDIWLLDDLAVNEVLKALQDAYGDYYDEHGKAEIAVTNVFEETYEGKPELTDVEFCIKVVFNEIEIDVIKLKRPAGEEVGVIDVFHTFDFPCNQFAILADSRVVGIGHLEPKQVAQRMLSEGRLYKLRSKLPDFEFIDLH